MRRSDGREGEREKKEREGKGKDRHEKKEGLKKE